MSSIVFSFVGKQDPYSENTNESGSIISLIDHLIQQQVKINRIILLYTKDTEKAAYDTKEYLLTITNNLQLDSDKIELEAVSQQLSEDPVNLLLATEAAKQAIAKTNITNNYSLELNASSGTPAMKTAWSILQAAGYAPYSRVWQVRNPKTQNSAQQRVFQTNLDFLRQEFDLKIIKQQLENYDYSGALITFQASSLPDNGVGTLLQYGAARLACAFPKAWQLIQPFRAQIGDRLYNQSRKLAQYHHQTVLLEIYFQILIRLHQQSYSDLLVKIIAFEENVLRLILKQHLLPQSQIDTPWDKLLDSGDIIKAFENYNNGQLVQELNQRNLNLNGQFSCSSMIKIAEYFYPHNSELLLALQELDHFRNQRNEYIHQLKGVASIKNFPSTLENFKTILQSLSLAYKPNSFELINREIIKLLS